MDTAQDQRNVTRYQCRPGSVIHFSYSHWNPNKTYTSSVANFPISAVLIPKLLVLCANKDTCIVSKELLQSESVLKGEVFEMEPSCSIIVKQGGSYKDG